MTLMRRCMLQPRRWQQRKRERTGRETSRPRWVDFEASCEGFVRGFEGFVRGLEGYDSGEEVYATAKALAAEERGRREREILRPRWVVWCVLVRGLERGFCEGSCEVWSPPGWVQYGVAGSCQDEVFLPT
jgi:hypothetical protein